MARAAHRAATLSPRIHARPEETFMAPFLAGLVASGLRLVANAALVKGADFIKEKTGVDVQQAALSDTDKLALQKFQAEHEEELLRLQLEDNKLSLEEAKIELEKTRAYLADVGDARRNQSAVQMSDNAPWYAKSIQPTLALLTVLATIGLFTFFVVQAGNTNAAGQPTLNATQKDIIIYILGVLSAAVTQILGYYFGSSQGSAAKNKSLEAMALATKSTGSPQ
jgi:hypothetical protein